MAEEIERQIICSVGFDIVFRVRERWISGFNYILLIIYSFDCIFVVLIRVTLFQSLMLKGINLTSASMATAMPNLAPGLVFLIAWAFRY